MGQMEGNAPSLPLFDVNAATKGNDGALPSKSPDCRQFVQPTSSQQLRWSVDFPTYRESIHARLVSSDESCPKKMDLASNPHMLVI